MDALRFDALARSISFAASRRIFLIRPFSCLVPLAAGVTAGAEAAKKKRKKRKKKRKRKCVPNCAGKTCGDDGCGGSCGPCNSGTCQDGTCSCPGGTESCGSGCVALCAVPAVRNPLTCGCCQRPVIGICSIDADCCSGDCAGPMCNGLASGTLCQFGAQCLSLACNNGICM